MPTPWAKSLPLFTTTIGPSRQRRGDINHHHHLAEPSAPMPTPWAESLPLITTTIGPSHQRRGNINHHYYWAEPSVPMPTPWAEPSILTSPQHPYPWAHPSASATAVRPAHPSEIPTISNGPIIGWPVSHGTLSTSAVR